MTSNATKAVGQGLCPAPFLQASLFSTDGGFIAGRFCSDLLPVECCLPCPSTDWLYADNFNTITESANWINVASAACSVFLLVSFACLPVEKTHRHYLSVCLTIGVALMSLGFIVPLAAKPDLCYDAITPNDMKTNVTCGISGALLIFGGWCGVMWVFLRAIALHLQICWQMVIGNTFMWGALATGWGIPALGLTVALIFSGVSFRFGDTCHINHKNSLATLWIPLLAFAAITVIVQFSTFGYCIKVYLASLNDDSTTTNSSGVRSFQQSVRNTVSPRQAYRRVRRVIELQWRGIAIVLLIIADVIFFAIIFVFMDNMEVNVNKNPLKAQDWLKCLIKTGGNKNKCLSYASSLTINEATVMSVLILLSLNGIWAFCLLGRFSMFTGWADLIMRRTKTQTEFISADVRLNKDPSNYEMLSRDRDREVHLANGDSKAPEPFTMSNPVTPLSPTVPKSGRETPDYFGREARYKSPARSFSGPNAPRVGSGNQPALTWDPTVTQARGFYPGMDPLSMNKI